MASDPITSWQVHGETVDIMKDFILGGSKITADDDCSHETNLKWHSELKETLTFTLSLTGKEPCPIFFI